MECRKSANLAACNCTYDPCPRKGICCECLSYHLRSRQLPACCFSAEALWVWAPSFVAVVAANRQTKTPLLTTPGAADVLRAFLCLQRHCSASER